MTIIEYDKATQIRTHVLCNVHCRPISLVNGKDCIDKTQTYRAREKKRKKEWDLEGGAGLSHDLVKDDHLVYRVGGDFVKLKQL